MPLLDWPITKALLRFVSTGAGQVPRVQFEDDGNTTNATPGSWLSKRPDETFAPTEAEMRDALLSFASVGAVFVGVDRIARSAATVPIALYEKVPVEDNEDGDSNVVVDPAQGAVGQPRDGVTKAYGRSHDVLFSKNEVGTLDEIDGIPGSAYEFGTTDVEVVAHPMKSLLRHPNRHTTSFQLMYGTYAHLLLAGNAYWLLDREPATGEIVHIFVPSPHRVMPKIEEGKKVFAHKNGGDPETKTWNVEDVIQFKWFNPASDILGMSSLRPVIDVILTNIFSGKWNKEFFERSARPDMVLETDEQVDDDTYRRLVREWEKTHQGTRRSHRPAFLTNGLKAKPFSESRKDMEFPTLRQMTWNEVLSALGVHPVLVGMNEESVSAEQFRLLRRSFWEETLLPLMGYVAETIEQFLFPKLHPITQEVFDQVMREHPASFEDVERVKNPGEKLALLPRIREHAYALPNELARFSVRYNVKGVPALKDKQSEESQTHLRYVQSGTMTINEVRKELNLPPVHWGDEPPLTSPVGASMMRGDVNEARTLLEPHHSVSPGDVGAEDAAVQDAVLGDD